MTTNPNWIVSDARRFGTAAVLLLAVLQPASLHGINFVGFGINFGQDLETEVTGTDSPATGEFDLKTGFRASAGWDFRLHRYISLQLESGFLYNEIDNEDVQDFDAWFGQVPVLVNLVFRYDFESGWTPFVGIGGGANASILDIEFVTFAPDPGEPNQVTQVPVDENSVTLVPAWQLMAGLEYRFNEHWSLSALYKYLETGSPEIDILNETFEFDTVHNHFVGLQFNFRF